MSSFGVEVHLVEMPDRVLLLEDTECAQVLACSFQKRRIAVSTGTKAVSMEKGSGALHVALEEKARARTTVEADQVLRAGAFGENGRRGVRGGGQNVPSHGRLLRREQGYADNQPVFWHTHTHVYGKEGTQPASYTCNISDSSAEFLIADGQLLSEALPIRQGKLVEAWIELHREELLADWELAKSGEVPFRIEPLR